jgi:hypothetical protein
VEATFSPETSVVTRSTRRHNAEDAFFLVTDVTLKIQDTALPFAVITRRFKCVSTHIYRYGTGKCVGIAHSLSIGLLVRVPFVSVTGDRYTGGIEGTSVLGKVNIA